MVLPVEVILLSPQTPSRVLDFLLAQDLLLFFLDLGPQSKAQQIVPHHLVVVLELAKLLFHFQLNVL